MLTACSDDDDARDHNNSADENVMSPSAARAGSGAGVAWLGLAVLRRSLRLVLVSECAGVITIPGTTRRSMHIGRASGGYTGGPADTFFVK